MAIVRLVTDFGETLLFSSQVGDHKNESTLALARSVDSVLDASPCVVRVNRNAEGTLEANEPPASCGTLFVQVSPYLTYSDLDDFLDAIASLVADDDRPLCFVCPRVSRPVRGLIGERFPHARVVSVN
jgi:hypothetical protein